jgi:hypothetical protein
MSYELPSHTALVVKVDPLQRNSSFLFFRRRVSIDACGEVTFKILTNLRVVRDEGSSTG